MLDFEIILPSKPIIVSEDDFSGVYEIEGLYPGYGYTLGNSLRRIILSSIPGFAVTEVKIEGASHEFTTLPGMMEDVITFLLNLKRVRFQVMGGSPQILTLDVGGPKEVTAADIKTGGEVNIINKDQHLATLTTKDTKLKAEIKVEKGLGYVPKELIQREKVGIGDIVLDAVFTPIKRVSYEVESMRVGNRTDYNRLRISLETDGIITPREALEKSIEIMIKQLNAIVGFREEMISTLPAMPEASETDETSNQSKGGESDALKTKIEDLNLSVRTLKALSGASIRTVSGLTRKREEDLLAISGLGEKGIQEIKRALTGLGLTLK